MGSVVVERTVSDRSAVTVRLRGDVDTVAGAHLRPVLVDMLMREKPARILIDLRHATALDASVLGTLRAAHELARDAKLIMTFASAGSRVAQQLVLQGLPATG